MGQCDNGYACVYQNNLSWSSPTTPLPAEAHPRVVFERLFGDGGTAADRLAELRKNASLLDWVRDDISRLQQKLGPGDRVKVNQYLDTVREVERRIQKAEAETADSQLPDLDRPVGVPAAYADHARLMFDLQVLALQGDVTRVITFQLARETSTRTYPEIGVPEAHHPLTHNGGNPEKLAKVAKINAFHVALFAVFPGKAESNAGRRRFPARPLGLPLRQRHEQWRQARPREPADPRRRRRLGTRRPPHPVRQTDAARQPAPDAARSRRRAPRLVRRQHGQNPGVAGADVAVTLLSRIPLLLAVNAAFIFAAGTDTRLADAAQQQDRAAVRALLARHADVNAAQVDGTTALALGGAERRPGNSQTPDRRRRRREASRTGTASCRFRSRAPTATPR